VDPAKTDEPVISGYFLIWYHSQTKGYEFSVPITQETQTQIQLSMTKILFISPLGGPSAEIGEAVQEVVSSSRNIN